MLNKLFVTILLSIVLSACGSNKKESFQGQTALQIYAKAEEYMAQEQYSKAITAYEALEARYPYAKEASDAQLGIIKAYYKNNEAALGLAAAERFIKMQPNHPRIDEAYYLQGMLNHNEYYSFIYRHLPVERSLRDTTLAQDAIKAFTTIVKNHPQSKYKAEALAKIKELRQNLAKHELHIANYYMKRKAYLAVVNRCDVVVKDYQDCGLELNQAYELMVEAYTKLGMTELANKAQLHIKCAQN